jgi:dienelactone hydrolase
MKRYWWILLVIVPLAFAAAFVVWGLTPQAPMSEISSQISEGAWNPTCQCLVFQAEEPSSDTGFIFYPGGHVDFRSYAPLMAELASNGYTSVIVKMPLSLAVLDIDAADRVRNALPEIANWVIGGHSLGGSMAAEYARTHPGEISGLVFLASYPGNSTDLSQTLLPVLSILAENDGLATSDKINAANNLLPDRTTYLQIGGGNHAQFGWYGEQQGDGVATITRERQQEIVVDAIIEFLKGVQP